MSVSNMLAVGDPVGLRRQQPEEAVPVLKLIDQILLVDPLTLPWISRGQMIPNRRQRQTQRRQPLLAIHHQPPREARIIQRRRSQHDRPTEMRRPLISIREQVRLLTNIAPELRQLLVSPRVSPLIQRDLKLLLPLDQCRQRGLRRLHPTLILTPLIDLRQYRTLGGQQDSADHSLLG
nr:hypothetical protein [Nocardia sp. SYP-A9097]